MKNDPKNQAVFTPRYLKKSNSSIFAEISWATSLDDMRQRLLLLADRIEDNALKTAVDRSSDMLARIRDCAIVFKCMIKSRSEQVAGFSVAQALWDIGHDVPRPDLKPGFYAEILFLLLGLQGKGPRKALDAIHLTATHSTGRQAAIERTQQLDTLWSEVDRRMASYVSGMEEETVLRRIERRNIILKKLNATLEDWGNWRWHIKNIIRDADTLEKFIKLPKLQRKAIDDARSHNLPFGITPYYISLIDDSPSNRDAAIRAQVLPPMSYVCEASSEQDQEVLDFMGEKDTSPYDLITRRYPAICILKPYNTCPQICVYCQRNWEIDDAMATGAFAGMDKVDAAINWIKEHPSLHEVLITGGDPLAMGNNTIADILEKIASIPSVERIRIGSRTLVTMPMRITEGLASLIGKYRVPGLREVAVVTHVQHPYEITPEMTEAVNKLRSRGVPVYNQLVYTYYTSKRFEAAALRRLLRLVGIDPYYTFNTKGKGETVAYRVPIARLLQEQQEEARLLPGLTRTDEAVYNVPRLGKSYLRAREYRNLLAIRPNGARVYEFHSWEKKISTDTTTYVTEDVPILNYLERLRKDGESISDYESIWYYY